MSMIALSQGLAPAAEARTIAARIGLGLGALAVVGIGLSGLAWIGSAGGLIPQAPAPNPFGFGMRETAAGGGLGGAILLMQAHFYAALTGSLQLLKADGAAGASLAAIGFLYGVFHAAGPGHGKGVISAYLLATRRSLPSALGLSLCSALLQACVAILLVALLALALDATMASVKAAARGIETASFAAIALVGAALLWRKSGEVAGTVLGSGSRDAETCGIAFQDGPPAGEARRGSWRASWRSSWRTSWRGPAAVILAAGIRPCSGAIVLLIFALSQDMFLAGILGTLAMALGTALTTGTLAALVVAVKSLATRLSGGLVGALTVAGVELLAAAFVLILGLVLLAGLYTSGLPGFLD